MKLYYSPGACSLAPHIALSEAGAKYELEKVDLRKHEYSGGDYRSVNPKGSVPAIRLPNGEVLTEAAVLLQFIADQSPQSGLAPQLGTLERYRLMEWLNYISSELHKGFGPLWNPNTPPEYREIAIVNLGQKFDYLAEKLKPGQFLTGSTFTIADAYLFTILNWAPFHKVDMSKWPQIKGYMEMVRQRPTVKAAMKEEGLPV